MTLDEGSMKKRLRELLEQNRLVEIGDLAADNRRVFGLLRSLTFDRDPLVGWRAVEAMGEAAARIGDDDPECVLEELRSLYWLLSEESGGICWHGPAAMAEIVRRTPEQSGSYLPITLSLLNEMADEDLDHFRDKILWGIGRLGQLARAELDRVLPAIEASLDERDPQVRGLAAWCLGQLGESELLSERTDLLNDAEPVELYENGEISRTSVRELVARARGTAAQIRI